MFNANSGVFVPASASASAQPQLTPAESSGEMNALSSSFTPASNMPKGLDQQQEDADAIEQEQVSRNGTYFYPSEGVSAETYDDVMEVREQLSEQLSEQY